MNACQLCLHYKRFEKPIMMKDGREVYGQCIFGGCYCPIDGHYKGKQEDAEQ